MLNRTVMHTVIVILLLIAPLSAAQFSAEPHPIKPQPVLVTRVLDGDTIEVTFADGTIEIVRFIGVDSPELNDYRISSQAAALLAKSFTKVVLYNKIIKLSFDSQRRGKYGRLLAYAHIGGRLFNKLLIERGHAKPYLYYPFNEEIKTRLIEAYKGDSK